MIFFEVFFGQTHLCSPLFEAIFTVPLFQNNHIPGILFFLSAAVMIVSSLLCFLFPETKDMDLEDTMHTSSTSNKKQLMQGCKEDGNKKWTTSGVKIEDKEITVTKF